MPCGACSPAGFHTSALRREGDGQASAAVACTATAAEATSAATATAAEAAAELHFTPDASAVGGILIGTAAATKLGLTGAVQCGSGTDVLA